MQIQQNIPLNNLNWFKTGGAAKCFAAPTNEKEFIQSLQFASQNKLQTFFLGSGANILISDAGFDGIVIKPELNKIEIQNETFVRAQTGTTIENLINFCLQNNLIGLEEFSGIPGTVGGSVYINIHYFNYFLSDFLVQATVINRKSLKIKTVDKNWFNFGYDLSKLHNKEYFLIDAIFKLKKVSNTQTAFAAGRSEEIIRHRNARYPTKNTCGSFFRNFADDEVKIKSNGKKIIFAAYYLDKLGIKGNLQIGKAIVSYKHANMIETLPGAKSKDVIDLARKIQKLVFKKFGILLQPECQLIGFKKYPLFNKSDYMRQVEHTSQMKNMEDLVRA